MPPARARDYYRHEGPIVLRCSRDRHERDFARHLAKLSERCASDELRATSPESNETHTLPTHHPSYSPIAGGLGREGGSLEQIGKKWRQACWNAQHITPQDCS